RAGTLAGSYEAASQDLLTYAGLEIDARQIQRMITQMAPRLKQWRQAQEPVFEPTAGDIFCVRGDGGCFETLRNPIILNEFCQKIANVRFCRTQDFQIGSVFAYATSTGRNA